MNDVPEKAIPTGIPGIQSDEIPVVPVVSEANGDNTIETENGEKVFEGEHIGFVQVGEDA